MVFICRFTNKETISLRTCKIWSLWAGVFIYRCSLEQVRLYFTLVGTDWFEHLSLQTLKSLKKHWSSCYISSVLHRLDMIRAKCRALIRDNVIQDSYKVPTQGLHNRTKVLWTLAICFTPAVGMTNDNFLKTRIKSWLKELEFWANSHTTPHHAFIN